MADEDGKKTKTKGKNKAGDKKVAAVAPTLDIDQVDNSSENMLRLFLIHCIDIVFPSIVTFRRRETIIMLHCSYLNISNALHQENNDE